MKYIALSALIMALPLLTACDETGQTGGAAHRVVDLPKPAAEPAAAVTATAEKSTAAGVKVLSWDNLLPDDFRPDKLFDDYDVQNLSDDDPRAQELMKKLQAMWKEAPVVTALHDQTVKLPGFVVPLEGDGQVVNEFLLVPYFGACIHVPPPPSNQIVHVTSELGVLMDALYQPFWIEGPLKVEQTSSELAEAGYQMEAEKIYAYELPDS